MMQYWQNYWSAPWMPMGMSGYNGGFFLFVAIVWSLVWKGLALWKAARKGENAWFVAMLVINTLGILEILYLYVFSQKKVHPVKEKAEKTEAA